jgi:hypothetical protein
MWDLRFRQFSFSLFGVTVHHKAGPLRIGIHNTSQVMNNYFLRRYKIKIKIRHIYIEKLSDKFCFGNMCVRFIHVSVSNLYTYSHYRSAYSAAGKYVDRFWEYINRSQTQKCGNWDWGRAIPFLGIHKRDFCCSVAQCFMVILIMIHLQPVKFDNSSLS